MTDSVTVSVRVVGTGIDGKMTDVIGEVKRGDEVLYSYTFATDEFFQSVGNVEHIPLDMAERWAKKNTDYVPMQPAA